jgi:hypothetical protein
MKKTIGNVVISCETSRECEVTKRIYNMVLKATDVCPEGELLTDKELERMKLNNVKRDWPETSKVKVYSEDVYFTFGVRFAAVIQEVIQENNGNKQNNI